MPSASDLTPFDNLRVWGRGGQRAPHKPLLALLALGRWQRGERGPVRFAELEGPLRDLLVEFGPPRRSHHPEFPFFHLQSDGVWVVNPSSGYPPRKGHTSPSARQFREAGAAGEFSPEVRTAFERDPEVVTAVAHTLLDAHFPPSVHEDIVAAVGLDLEPTSARTARDPAFREAVLLAYGYACAVCRVGIRLGHSPVGIEAAHIRWHACGGPDVVTNGLCLCSLHHKLFDRGALTLTLDGKSVWVSERANERNVRRALGRYHGRPLARPARAEFAPDQAHITWHHGEVYQGERPD